MSVERASGDPQQLAPRLLPANSRIALLGDSRLAHAFSVGATTSRNARGLAFALGSQSRERFTFLPTDMFAVSGYTSTQVLTLLHPSALASTAGAVMILCSTNDPGNSISLATTLANMSTMVAGLAALGKRVFLIAEYPRGNSTFTSTRLTSTSLLDHMAVRNWCLNVAPQLYPNVVPIDLWPIMEDQAGTAGDIIAALSYDGLHLGTAGAMVVAPTILNTLNLYYPPRSVIQTSGADTYDATHNPSGNTLANGRLTGTSGSVTGTGFSGSAATSWNLSPNTALAAGSPTVVASKVTTSPISGAGNWQQLVISGTTASNAGPAVYFDQFLNGAALNQYAAGDVLELVGEWEVDSGVSNLYTLQVLVSRNATSSTFAADAGEGSNGGLWPSSALAGTWRTPTLTVDKTETSFQVRIYAIFKESSTIAATVRFRNLSLRKV